MFRFWLIIVATLMSFASSALPPQVKVCARKSPRLAECFRDSMESLRPYLKNGNFGQGFVTEGLDPLLIGDISMNRGFDLKLIGLQSYGVSNFKVEKIRVSLEPIKVEMVLSIPKITTKAFYNLNWSLGLLNLKGRGEHFTTMENSRVLLRLTGTYYLRNSVQYMKFDNAKVNFTPGKTRMRFENLFNGQKALEDVANDVINQNLAQIGREAFPQIEKGMERKILKAANQFVEKASFDELFPL